MKNLEELLFEKSSKDPSLEFYLERERTYHLEFRDSLPFLEEEHRETLLTIRYINQEGLCGITYTLNLSGEAIDSSIKLAQELSSLGKSSLYPPLASSYPEVPFSPRNISPKELFSNLHNLARESLNQFKYITRLEREALTFSERQIYLFREGRALSTTWEEIHLFFSVVARSEKREASSYALYEGKTIKEELWKRLTERACEKAEALSKAERRAPLKVHTLFPPECAIELLSLLALSFRGDEVFKGRSFLKDKLGKKVFSSNLTLVDDGLTPDLMESRPFDDEGMPQGKTLLLDKGEIKGYIWDYYYGKKSGFTSTGNARKKDPASPPQVDFTNLYFLPGEKERAELLQREDRVFEVLEILGAHTANPISGDFSFGVSGILYEGGEPVDYLSEMALFGNIFEIFKEVELGRDLTFLGSLATPSLLFPKLVLG